MCIIFYSESGKLPAKSALRVAYENNPDGVGIMYHDGKKVQVIRGLLDFDAAWSILCLLRNHGHKYACHFRYRTKGPISSKTCHPFKIRHTRTGFNTFMMHNGTFLGLDVPKGQSDTQVMASNLEGLVNRHGAHILGEKSILNNMGKKVGAYNKILFMNDNGDVQIVNAKSGIVKGGIW
jgi:predicted glutamine amidotransferase